MLTEPIVEDVENDQVNFRDDSIKTEDPEVASQKETQRGDQEKPEKFEIQGKTQVEN